VILALSIILSKVYLWGINKALDAKGKGGPRETNGGGVRSYFLPDSFFFHPIDFSSALSSSNYIIRTT